MTAPLPRLATTEEVAKETGVAAWRWYEWAATGVAPGCVRFGRAIRWNRQALADWLAGTNGGPHRVNGEAPQIITPDPTSEVRNGKDNGTPPPTEPARVRARVQHRRQGARRNSTTAS